MLRCPGFLNKRQKPRFVDDFSSPTSRAGGSVTAMPSGYAVLSLVRNLVSVARLRTSCQARVVLVSSLNPA
jgi:hypothetical protein